MPWTATASRRLLPLLLLLVGALPAAAQIIQVVPSVTIPGQRDFTLEIGLDTAGQEVMGMEISIRFDPAVVRLDGVDAGSWFTAPGVDYFFWDYTHVGTDLIRFAAARLGAGSSESGILAVCRFYSLAPGVSQLEFLGVTVRNSLNETLTVGHSSGDHIIVDIAIPVARTSFDGVKALFR